MSGPPQTLTARQPTQRGGVQTAVASRSPLAPETQLDPGKTATPVLIARARNTLVILTLFFAVLSGMIMISASGESADAAAAVAQSARLRGIAISLSQAEQIVSDQVLAGTADTGELDKVTDQAVADLVAASAASPDQANDLAGIAVVVTNYRSVAGSVLRQNDPITSDVTVAGSGLASSRNQLNELADRSDANAVELRNSGPSAFAAVVGWLVVAAAIVAMITTARRTHRVINVGLLLGAVLMSFSSILMGINATAASAETSGALARGRLLALSEMAVRQTKAYESLLFLDRYTSIESDYRDASFEAESYLLDLDDPDTFALWKEFKTQHSSVTPGTEAAKELGTSATGTSKTIQQITDRLSAERSDTFAQATEASKADSGAPIRALVATLFSLGAAGAFVVGARRVRREYQAG